MLTVQLALFVLLYVADIGLVYLFLRKLLIYQSTAFPAV